MSLTPLAFTGISKFSADFQTILDRTVKIASQPIQILQSEQADLLGQKQLATNLNGAVASLAESVERLGSLGASKAIAASSSNLLKVSVGTTTATAPATYTIREVTSTARNASASSAGYADAAQTIVAASGQVKLTVGGTVYSASLAADQNNLEGLRDWINSLDAGVTASILDAGGGATPYYLSVTANQSGERPIALVDDAAGAPVDLIATRDNGANAAFKINGVSVSKESNLISDVVPGLTFTIAGTTTGEETVTLSLATDRGRLASALRAFVDAYNDVVDQVDAQIGESAGMLSGNFIIREAQEALRQLGGFSGAGDIQSLAELGVEFDSKGKASFESDVFYALADTQIQQAFDFLGSATTGFGALAGRLNSISDPVTGLIRVQQDHYDLRDRQLQDQVAAISERVSAMQASTALRLQAADALLAQLESQQTVLDASIQSLQLALFGKKED